MAMLAAAMEKAGSTDVDAVAAAMEGMEIDNIWGGKVLMRAEDHQLIQDVHIHAHTDEGVTFPYDNSKYGIVVESSVPMASADAETSCKMKRPS